LATVAFVVLQGGALWAIYAATGSDLAQLATLSGGALVWVAMRHQADRRRPFPPKSSVPSMTIRGFAEAFVLVAALAAPAFLFGGALEDGGHWLWFYVFFLVPQIFIWNTEAMFKRYGGSFTDAVARPEAKSS
jgi:hypothetical protein